MPSSSVRGDLSGPIVAILITVVVVAAGLVAGMWFLRSGTQIAKSSMLTVIGQPTLVPTSSGTYAYVSLKNVGTESTTVQSLVIRVGGQQVTLTPTSAAQIPPGATASIEFTTTTSISPTNSTVPGVIVTDHGTIPVVLYVISNATNSTSTTTTTAATTPG